MSVATDRHEPLPRYWVEDRVEVIDGYVWADFIPRRGDIIPVCLGKAEDVAPAARGEVPVPEGLSNVRRAILTETIEEVKDDPRPDAGTIRRFSFQRASNRASRRNSRPRGRTAS